MSNAVCSHLHRFTVGDTYYVAHATHQALGIICFFSTCIYVYVSMYSLTRCAWQSSLRFLLCSLWRVKTSLRKISVSEAREWILYQWRCAISAWCPWSFPLRLFRPTPVSQEYLKQNDGAQKSWNVSIVTVTRQFTIRNTTYCKIDKIIRELLRSDEIMCGIWACPCITGKLNTCLVVRTCYANTASDIKFCIKEHITVST